MRPVPIRSGRRVRKISGQFRLCRHSAFLFRMTLRLLGLVILFIIDSICTLLFVARGNTHHAAANNRPAINMPRNYICTCNKCNGCEVSRSTYYAHRKAREEALVSSSLTETLATIPVNANALAGPSNSKRRAPESSSKAKRTRLDIPDRAVNDIEVRVYQH